MGWFKSNTQNNNGALVTTDSVGFRKQTGQNGLDSNFDPRTYWVGHGASY